MLIINSITMQWCFAITAMKTPMPWMHAVIFSQHCAVLFADILSDGNYVRAVHEHLGRGDRVVAPH